MTTRIKFQCLILSLVIVSLSIRPGSAQSQPPMTFDDIMNLRVVSDPHISPDGKSVAFVVTQADMKSNFRNSDIWLVSSDGGEPRPMTNSARRDDSPQWSPDSRQFAFLSDRDGKAQIYLMAIDGGEPRRLTDSKMPVQVFCWSTDGKKIAYTAADPLPESREKEKKDGFDQIIADTEYPYAQINLIDVASPSTVSKLTSGPLHVEEVAWSPDGTSIAFTGRSTTKLADAPSTEVYAIDLAGQSRQPVQLTKNERAESSIKWSPDGRMISFLSTSDKYASIGPSRIHWLKFWKYSGAIQPDWKFTILRPEYEGYVRDYQWSNDSKFIYFSADVSVNRKIGRMSADASTVEWFAAPDKLIGSCTLSRDSQKISFLSEGPDSPADIFSALTSEVFKSGFVGKRLTNLNPQSARFAKGRVETIKWKSKDGREIEGILIYPVGYEAGKRYPLLTSIHGGPEGAYQLSFMASYAELPHLYAARGYASFFPNFRGSSNYGPEFASANVNDLGGGDYNDIMSGVDYLIDRGIADPSRLAIKGYSYGGYMSGWIIGHTDRFKAAVFGAGLSNAISYYSQADIQFSRETLHQGNPWRNNQNMIERSPVFYLQNARTPSLIYQGEKDERVPLPQSLETYMGLKKAGVTAQLVIYPREGHGLREPKHQLDKMRREAEWIEKFIGVDRSSAAR